MMVRSSRAVLGAGMLTLLAALGCIALLSGTRSSPAVLLEGDQSLWLGEHAYINGLQDDGKYMVPYEGDEETSGNSLFDFGLEGGTKVDPETRMPAPGKIEDTRFWKKPNGRRPGLFDIRRIRRDEDGYIPWWKRYSYYNNDYPQYRDDYQLFRGPQVEVEDGHVSSISDDELSFGNGFGESFF
mmetsp:Transcript_45891/g.71900  ORF Transcript_45891/g.71900 Transcript_45891/m.71900 type:complete len:184 (-) Transcript_45891:54-605(-)|eukprot:CAMPEP_0184314540 /NCGR_PEP_ID=MMETSP1049-20130417/75204_1 /TAXON_ID=77928 /ORGANISM="Proteomonas sulcata, Strain CCMP704" /LENGTH=183 /DNA_ID=CAMNT_0026632517 /DNA_START=39 /DNA_END=590 /DNA_ORIENTATION=-